MKTLSIWLQRIALTAVMAGMLYLWQGRGLDGAGNVFLGMIWFGTVLNLLMAMMARDEKVKVPPKRAFARHFSVLHVTGMAFALLWFGFIFTAVCYGLSNVIVWAAVDTRRKKDAAAEAKAQPESAAA